MHKRLELKQLNRLLNEDERFVMMEQDFETLYPYCRAIGVKTNNPRTDANRPDLPMTVYAVYDMTKLKEIENLSNYLYAKGINTYMYDNVTFKKSFKESLSAFWAEMYPRDYLVRIITRAGYSCD